MGSLPRKQETVESLKEALSTATMTVVTDYRGLSVAEMTTLRRDLLKENARLTVAKNTLLKRAIDGTANAGLAEFLKGPTAVLVANADQIAPLKLLKTFYKQGKKENELRGGLMDGQILTAKDLDALASLPPLNELRAKLVGGIASPLNGIVSALSSPQRALVNVLDQYAKQKQAAGA
ncbi:MAG: 50S ribosomal protein L10 [Candidatus Melainabacteria bacterium]